MKNITLKDAVTFVRASIDELAEPSDMLVDEILDDRNLHLTVRHLLPEAFNEIVLTAPAHMLDGVDGKNKCSTVVNNADGVMSITTSIDDFLRIASFKASNSDVVVIEAEDEGTPVGRMQLNKYVRGTYDAPVLVRMHGQGDSPSFKYYSCIKKNDAWDTIAEFKYIQRAKELDGDDDSIQCPDRLKNAVLDYLVGIVLQTYNEADKAQLFIKRATDMLNIQ